MNLNSLSFGWPKNGQPVVGPVDALKMNVLNMGTTGFLLIIITTTFYYHCPFGFADSIFPFLGVAATEASWNWHKSENLPEKQ